MGNWAEGELEFFARSAQLFWMSTLKFLHFVLVIIRQSMYFKRVFQYASKLASSSGVKNGIS